MVIRDSSSVSHHRPKSYLMCGNNILEEEGRTRTRCGSFPSLNGGGALSLTEFGSLTCEVGAEGNNNSPRCRAGN
eukprot:1345731-Amorphochlora_amoeboformis.AAC.1